MSIKKAFGILSALALLLALIPVSVAAATIDEAKGSGTKIYADYGTGFEFLTELEFDKKITEEKIDISRPVIAVRIVKGDCYELNLDQVTLNGKCPAGYERKLSATDNDLIEVEGSIDLDLKGSGELIIAARAPKELKGEEYSFKFPVLNQSGITSESQFYTYKIGSNPGTFSMGDELVIPGEEYVFDKIMCHPSSGHPDAPMDIYTADDGKDLYVFFEAFLDNTFDHGKDFAAVHVRCGDEIKTYKVHTTAENEYGRWYFDYTDSSDVYNWEHMCYVVKVPMEDLTAKDGNLDLAFEYYGTAYTEPRLLFLCIGDVSLADKSYSYSSLKNADYSLPEAGKTLNNMGGNTKSGIWWITNVGLNEDTEVYDYELTLCNASITARCDDDVGWSSNKYNLMCAGNLTIVLKDGTNNTIGQTGTSAAYYGAYLSGSDYTIKGNGSLSLYGYSSALYGYGKLKVSDGARVQATVSTGSEKQEDSYALSISDGIVIDGASVKAENHVATDESFGIVTYSTVTVMNDGSVESYTSGGTGCNLAFSIANYKTPGEYYKTYGGDSELYEGSAPSGKKVSELTNCFYFNQTLSTMPYVKIISKRSPEKTPEAVFTATGTDCGTLGNVTTANVVSLDGGSTWTAVTGDNMALTGVTVSKGIRVKLPTEDPLNFVDSEEQVIKVTQASRPTGLGKTDITTKGGTGSITGVKTTMEYRKDGETAYKAITSTSVTGLAAGKYYVRVKAAGTVLASPDSSAIVINPYKAPTITPTKKPTVTPTKKPTAAPTKKPTATPTKKPTAKPTKKPTATPTPKISLTLNKSSAEIVCAKMLTLKATAKGTNKAVSWSSSNTKIATVDKNGKITAKQAGPVTITASVAGKSAACNVTVLYKDVTSSSDFWYAPTNYLTAKGVVKGYDNQTKFKPDNECTRAQMLTFMWRLMGEPKTKQNSCKFPDVKSGDYFFKPVIWAVEKGITTGYSDGKFKPQNVCTRAQTVTFLWRMAGKPGVANAKNPFSDVKENDYFYNAVLWASGKNIAAGYKGGTFKPQGTCLRRQMVTFLYKYDKYVNKKG